MGRQVNFYMLADDLAAFEAIIRSKENIVFVKDRLLTPELQTIETLAVPQMGITPLLLYLVRESDLDRVVVRSVAGKYWEVDILRSPAVELMRSYHDSNCVRRGRLYFQPGYYDDQGQWQNKPPAFLRWANGLLRWIRRNYHRDPLSTFYVGPNAQKWVSEGNGVLKLN